MKAEVKNTEIINSRQIKRAFGLAIVSRIFIFTFGIVSVLLLFPTYSNLSVFAKGDFTYLESVGFIFVFLTFFTVFMFFLSKIFQKLKTTSQLIRNIVFVGLTGANVLCMMLIITFVWIRYDVKTHCEVAKIEYGGSCLGALSRQLDDVNQSFRSRTSAIWALGQLADRKSLPILKQYYTGNISKREPLNKTISQYELEKAIRWCERGNITSWMYKGL